MTAKGHDVPALSGVFELLLRAYHGNNCLDRSHLGSRLQGLMITNAWRWRRIEKETKRRCRERRRVVVVTDDATVGVVVRPNGALRRQ